MTENLFEQGLDNFGVPQGVEDNLGLQTGSDTQEGTPRNAADPLGGQGQPIDPPSKKTPSYQEVINSVKSDASRLSPFADNDFLRPRMVSGEKTRKYEDMPYGYRYGVDMDDLYGEAEGPLKTFGKGAARFGLGVVTKVGQGAGFLLGLANPSNWDENIISNAADNGITALFDQLDEVTKQDWLPTFQEAADREKGFWNKFFTDGDFWATDAVDGAAFLVSAWVPGIGLSKLNLGTKIAQGLSSSRLGIGAAEASIEGAAMAQNYLTKANSLFKNGIDKFNAWALATGSEAMFEAAGTRTSIMNSLTTDETGRLRINPETGAPYTDEEKKRIAGAGAQDAFVLNAALLAATNTIELKWLGSMFNSAEKAAVRGIGGATGLSDKMVAQEAIGKFSKFLSSGKGAFVKGGVEGILSEGFVEENAQLAIQRITEEYGHKGKIAEFGMIGSFLSQFVDQTINALTGKDKEAAESIGLGGILGVLGGGTSSFFQQREDQSMTDQAITAYNNAQANWLKFGNIYRTKEVVTKDANGNEIKTEQIVLDQNNKPIVDQNKLTGVLTGYTAVNAALDQASGMNPGFQREVLRDTAFADFVIAHINAGIGDTVLDKLSSIEKASPEELAKLGFVAGENAKELINRYKGLATSIINQNKLINSDILLDGSKEDNARKNFLIKLAADQAVYKMLQNENQGYITQLQNQLVNDQNSSLSDGIVDQLNELTQRMKSQEEILKDMGTSPDTAVRRQVADQVLKEIKDAVEQLEKNNETTLSTLKKDKDGFYQYEKPGRNQPGISDQYKKKVRLRAEMQNHIRSLGFEWAKYADTIDGKKNFMQMFKEEVVDPLQAAAEAQKDSQPTQGPGKGRTITLTGVDQNNNPKSIDITEGELYIGKLHKSVKFTGKKQPVLLFNNDKIRIVSISEDGSVVTISSYGETLEISAAELADVAISENWKPFNSLTDDQKLYISLRNQSIEYRVLERDASGKPIKKANGKYKTKIVKGRVALTKDKKDLLFVYLDPTTGKKRYSDFDMAYVINKQSLEAILANQKPAADAQAAKIKQKYEKQQEYLNNLITETETKLTEAQARREANNQEFEKFEKELKDLKEMLQEATAYLEKNPYTRGRKSNMYVAMEKMAQELTAEISKKEQQLAMLQKEKEDLTTLLDALNRTSELYYEGLIELEESGEPFLRDQSGVIYSEEKEQLADALKSDIITRFSGDELAGMVSDTEAEIDLIDERVNLLQAQINTLRKMLSKVLAYKDVADILMNVTDREELRNALKMLERQDTVTPDGANLQTRLDTAVDDIVKQDLVKALRKGLASGKGIEAAYTLELVNQYKEAVSELEELIQKRDVLAPKLIRLQTARDQENLVTSLQERIEFLKAIQEGFTAQYQAETSAQTAQRQASAAEVVQKNMLGDKLADQEVSQEEGFYNYDTKMPLLAVNGLFTTAGRHFIDDADTQLNMENNNAMFYKLSASADIINDEYYLMPVTAANDTFGIRRTDVYEDDIKLVVVKKVGNEFKYVDVNGNVQENPTKETLIYTSMHGNTTMFGTDAQAAVNSVKRSFTPKGVTDAEILDHIKRLKAFREKIKSDVAAGKPAYIPVTGKSKGLQVYVEKDANGLPQELPLEGRLISEETMDYNNLEHPDGQSVSLIVSTVKDNTAVDVKPGRVVMQKADGTTFRVFNRQLSQAEKDNFVNVLKVLSGLLARKNSPTTPLSKQEARDLDDILTYLNGLVFWTDPKNTSPSANKFFINPDTGMLHRGENVVALTADAIEGAKQMLTDNLYHQVNNKLVKSKNPFFQVIVDNNNKITKVEYQNYVHYLLGTQDLKGKERLLGTPVVYTNTPTYSPDDLTPQLKSVYFTFQDPDNPIVPKVVVTQNNVILPATQSQPNSQPVIGTAANGFTFNPNASAQPAGSVAQPKASAPVATSRFVYNPNSSATQPAAQQPTSAPAAGMSRFVYNPNQAAQPQAAPVAGQPQAPAVQDPPIPANPFMMPGQVTAPPPPIVPTTQTTAPVPTSTESQVIAMLNRHAEPSSGEIEYQGDEFYEQDEVRGEPTTTFGKILKGLSDLPPAGYNFTSKTVAEYKQKVKAFLAENGLEENFNGILANIDRLVKETSAKTTAAPAFNPTLINKILSEQYQQSLPSITAPDDKVNNVYRLALDNIKKTENFKKLAAWFSKNLPQIPVEKVAQMIDGIAWGAFKDGAIYLAENAEEGTGFHEAFEAVWASYLTVEEQVELAKAFRSLKGEFTNPFTRETKPYSQASMYDVREMLAEGMRDYMLERNTYGGKILAFFKELWEAIQALFGLSNKSEAEKLINDVYKSINKGKYVNAKTVRDVKAMGTVYAQAIPGTTQEFSTQFTEGLTGFFFMNLYKSQKNIDSLIDKGANTNKLLRELFVQSMEDMKQYLVGPSSIFAERYVNPVRAQLGRELTQEELTYVYTQYLNQNRNAHQIEQAFAYPKEIYNNLKTSLKKFGLQFKESANQDDEEFVNKKEDSVTDALGIRDAIYIDPRRLTAVNFRMLIGSLTSDMYNDEAKSENNPMGIVFEKNNLGLPKMVDFDDVHNLLINELNGSASRIEKGRFIDALTDMFNKLDQKYKLPNGRYKPGYVWIQRLKNRVKYAGTEGTYFNSAKITQDDISLMIGFEKSLMNKQNLPVKTIIGEKGYIFDTDPIQTNSQVKIREQWENNVMTTVQPLSRKSPSTLLGVADNGLIVIDRESHIYKGNPANTSKPYFTMARPTFNQMIEILGELGIKFSVDNEQLKKHKVVIARSFSAIREKIADGTINTMAELYSPNIVNKAISDLIDIEVEYNAEDNVLMHFTADGKPQYSITLPSNVTYVLNSLNDAKTLADFVSSNPQFGYIDGSGAVVLHPYQSRSLLLRQGGLIFDEDGNKRADMDLKYHLISGVAQQNSDGTNTADLTYPDRVMQEIHYLLKNIHYTVINSDKSTEFGIGVNQSFVSYRDASAEITSPDFQNVISIYLDQLEDEMDAAIREQQVPSNIQYYSKEVKKLGHYREILGDNLVKDFTDKVLTGNMTKEAFLNQPAVTEAIQMHIMTLTQETLQGLIDLDIITRVQIGNTSTGSPVYEYSTKAISHELLSTLNLTGDKMNQAEIESLMTYLAVNKEIAVTEQHKLIFGHPVIYKDLAKRANGVNSTKDAIIDNHEVIKWMDANIPRLDGKARSADVIQTFKNISFQDVTALSVFYKDIAEGMYASMREDLSKAAAEARIGVRFDDNGKFKSFILDKNKKITGEIKGYIDLTEQDGQGYIMPDFYRDMLYLSAKFSKEQLRQWEYEKAYEIVSRSQKRKNHPAYKDYSKIYTKEQMDQFKQIVKAGSPGAIMQPLKPQYFGYAKNSSLMQTVFLKHSVQPKFYRHVENTQFENVYLAAQNNQVDIIGYESGQKVGNMLNNKGEFLPIYDNNGQTNARVEYDEKGNTKSVNLPDGLPVQELFTRYYGIQQEVPGIAKTKVVRGTQVTKLVMTNFKVNGEFTSQRAGELIGEYNKTLVDMIRLGKEELLEELGMQRMSDGSYVVADIKKMIQLLRDELEKRDLPNNLIDAIQPTADGSGLMYKFDTLANRNKIDNILNSIVDSRVISEKMFGKAAVQVASTGFETGNRTFMYLNKEGIYEEVGDKELTKDEKKTVRATSNDLKFYRNVNGSIQGMEVYLPWFFDGVSPEDMGLKLTNGVYQFAKDKDGNLIIPEWFDSKLLEAIGFRIPTQGMNSIESMIIKGFLPQEMGDMMVVPSEIVGKAGSDFDIDKLNIYLSNYYVVGGKIKYLERGLTEEQLTEIAKQMYAEKTRTTVATNQLINTIFGENAPNDETDFVNEFIHKYNKKSLQNRFKEIMQELVALPENYRQLVVPNGATTLKGLADDLKELKGQQDAEKSILALRKFIPMAEVRQRYITGKTMVGTAALHTTSHTMAQISGLKLTGTYDPKRLQYLFSGMRQKDVVIRLRHNSEKGELYLYAKQDASGAWISELISEALTGFVDAAKDPFVFELNLNLATADTWFYLQKVGVPVQDIAYLFNQPIIDQYFKEQAKNQSYFKKTNGDNMSNFVMMLKVADPYMDKIPDLKGTYEKVTNLMKQIDDIQNSDASSRNDYQKVMELRKAIKAIREKTAEILVGIQEENKQVKTETLKNAIKNYYAKGYKLNEKDARFQLGMLVDYLEYNQQARFLKQFIKAIGYDNTRTKSIIENELQNSRWNKMVDSKFIANPEAILDTFIGEMKTQKEDLPNLFKDFFMSLHPKAQPAFEPLKRQINNPEIEMSADDQAELINKYQNFFITYIIQTTPYIKNGIQTSLNAQYESLMKGAMSMGKQLKYLRELNDPNVSENLVVKELLPILNSDSTQVDNIKLFKNRMDTYKNNVLIESIENLYSYAKATGNTALQNFVENLGTFAILQTGLQEGGLNFNKILPVHLYTRVVNEIMTNFTNSGIAVDPQLVWRQFHQNNWRNSSITPKIKFAKIDKLNNTLTISEDYADSQYDYVAKTTLRPDITGRGNEERRRELLKQKRYNEVFETIVYEKVQSEVDLGDGLVSVFRPIQKLGDSYRFVEVYADNRPSILPQNHTVDLNTGAVQNTHIVEQNISITTPASAVKPVIPQQTEPLVVASAQSKFVLKRDSFPGLPFISIGSLPMQPDNISKIKAGTKTITNRTAKLADGIYTLPDGTQVKLTYQGQADVEYIGDSVLVTASDTGRTWAGDEFAKAEGFKDWADFQKNQQFSEKFVDGKQSRYIYEVVPVASQPGTAPQAAPTQALSNLGSSVTKIISGGQTGIDRLGLEVGKSLGIQTGGTATPGFVTEKGNDESLKEFGVQEISPALQAGRSGREFYLPRTEQNVLNSDGTVYFATDTDSAGKIATERFAKQHNKPFLLNPTADQLRQWLATNNIKTLNVAGNRGSKMTAEQRTQAENVLRGALGNTNSTTSQTDQQIRNSPEYKQWLANNSNPLMSEQENFEYYKKCNL